MTTRLVTRFAETKRGGRAALVACLAMVGTTWPHTANAEESFIIGSDAIQPAVELNVEPGSELIDCGSNGPMVGRCLLADSDDAERVISAYRRQLIHQGWRAIAATARQPERLAPPNTLGACPNTITIRTTASLLPGRSTLQDNKIKLVFEYGTTLDCVANLIDAARGSNARGASQSQHQ